jgi:23S rRNA pseudouridine1911/1915/1917 synthase
MDLSERAEPGDRAFFEFEAGEGHPRLDEFLALRFPESSRTLIRRGIARGDALVNGSPGEQGRRLDPGDIVRFAALLDVRSSMTPEPIPLEVLHECSELIVVNKQQGLLVHPSSGQKTGTLCNALAWHFMQAGGAAIRPGLLHRLDRGTSGIMVIAKTPRAHRIMARAFHRRKVSKQYLALVHGRVEPDSGEIDAAIGRCADAWPRWGVRPEGKEARTRYAVRQRYAAHTWLELEPLTGRTHQLRIHCAAMGHAIVGDCVYGAPDKNGEGYRRFPWPLLHAFRLSFLHPETGVPMTFCVPPPPAMLEALAAAETGALP